MSHYSKINEDNEEYFRFTWPQRLDKAIHTLEGLLVGLSADGKVNQQELAVLTRWMTEHSQYSDRHPFNEILARLYDALTDGIFDAEERADVLWLCNKFSTDNTFFDFATADMQRLQGMLGGIAIDGKITVEELTHLEKWLQEHEHLRKIYPYDELESLLLHVLKDGVIDDEEHAALMRFFTEFLSHAGHRAVGNVTPAEAMIISGCCAVCPEIVFEGSRFCFTGRSERCSRKQLAEIIVKAGGLFSDSVTQQVSYLIVGCEGNECWAYSCYGRKVEKAIEYRKKGLPLLIVHENDFWDAVEDGGNQ